MMLTAAHQDLFSMTWLPPLVVLSFLLIMILHILKRRSKTETKSKFPPGPPKLPLIGNLHQLGKLPHQSLCKLSQEIYGPVMLLRLGNIPTLVISSAKMAKQVLKIHDIDFCSRSKSPGSRKLLYNFSDVAFAPYNDQWRERRKIFASHLLNSRSQSFSNAREVEINQLIESLSSVESLNPVNIDEKMVDLVGEIITSVSFGKSYKEKSSFKASHELKHVLDEAMVMLDGLSAEDFFPSFGWIIDFLSGRRARLNNCFAKLDAYLQMMLDEHLDHQRSLEDDDE